MLGRIALRMATIEALKGSTLVDGNVLDSQIGALDIAADGTIRTDQEKPFISVYVEASKQDGGFNIRGLHKTGLTELVIEIGITTAMTETDTETGASSIVGLQIPPTDQAFEFFLDCVGRQVVNTLTDPTNEWAEIWRGLSSEVVKCERRRTTDTTNGSRIAAHQIVITVDLLPDPVYGEPVAETSIWNSFFEKLGTYSDTVTIKKRAALLDLLGDPDEPLSSETQRRRFGLTLEGARAIFDMPVEPAEDFEPNIASVSVDITPEV